MAVSIIRKILIINLSNIGDVVLTLPSLDMVKANLPGVHITMLVAPKVAFLFESDSRITQLVQYDKHSSLRDKIALMFQLRKARFDIVIDFRHTVFPLFLGAWYTTPLVHRRIPPAHKSEWYRNLTMTAYPFDAGVTLRPAIAASAADEEHVKRLLLENGISESTPFVVVAPGAADHKKRWTKDGFAELCDRIKGAYNLTIVFVSDRDNTAFVGEIKALMKQSVVDLSEKTTLKQLALVLKRCSLLICNDSGAMHIGSYLGVPLVAIFGPTDPRYHGPWNVKSRLIRRPEMLSPSERPVGAGGSSVCLSAEAVFTKVQEVFNLKSMRHTDVKFYYKRILITRTDRIGDVVISTPAFKAVRDHYPNAHIAVMVRPYARDIVEGNPFIDEVILFDKEGIHKSLWGSLKFIRMLRRKKLDIVINLHPSNRVHLISFLAGIPERVGYDRKCGSLLTTRVVHAKQDGEKHERDYALDVLRAAGIDHRDTPLFVPLRPESEAFIEQCFKDYGIASSDTIIALHPGASCVSKLWPAKRFAQTADALIEKFKCKIVIVAGSQDVEVAASVVKAMRNPSVNLAGKTTLSQLASLLKRCRIFISNDSGPVHIACAVGIPVISIFGRHQAGLSPRRWGPTGENDIVLHKNVGCVECLAHNCTKGFLCLQAIEIRDVMEAVDELSKLW